jgi:hypothetical protein
MHPWREGLRSCARHLLALTGLGVGLGCGDASDAAVPIVFDEAPLPNVHAGGVAPPHAVVSHRAHKICQLLGDSDLSRHEAVQNSTDTEFKVRGSDLGISVRRGDDLLFLFGDTWAGSGVTRPSGADAFATVDARLPFRAACEGMSFPRQKDGGFDPITLDGLTLPDFNVPTGAFTSKDALYTFFTVADADGRTIGEGGGRGVLGRSSGDQHFSTVRAASPSSARFDLVSATKVDGHPAPHLPATLNDKDVVLLFGTGAYRQSFPFLAVADAEHPEAPWLYFGGLGRDHAPVWTPREESAMAIFPNDTSQACVGDMSVAYSTRLARWLMLYNCHGRIYLRTAAVPWGGWSLPMVVFSRFYDGFGSFVHHPCGKDKYRCGDHDYSEGQGGHFGQGESGDVYAPYLVPDYFFGDEQGREHVVFTMSTWNPYTTVLMEVAIEKTK